MKASTIAWIAFFIITGYWMSQLVIAYDRAIFATHYAIQDMRNSQAKEMLFGKQGQ